MSYGQDILELDDLLCSPERRSERDHIGTLPVGQRDQLDAASRTTLAGAILSALMMPGARTSDYDFAELPGWLRLGLIEAMVNYTTGTGLTCPHAPSIAKPGPIFACAWRREAFTCVACAPMLFPEPGSAADHTCDVCGHVCVPNGGSKAGITVSAHTFGPLTYAYGRCPECGKDRIGADR